VRESVDAATFGPSPSASSDRSSARPRVHGPSLPSHSDMVLAREEESERHAADRQYKRKRDRIEDKERVEEIVGPKEVGREGMLEKKRVKRDSDRTFREKGDDGFMEADEGTLMGGGSDFKEQYVLSLNLTLSLICQVTDSLPYLNTELQEGMLTDGGGKKNEMRSEKTKRQLSKRDATPCWTGIKRTWICL
jgi:hypothetical protein